MSSVTDNVHPALETFNAHFSNDRRRPPQLFRAPGRVNLIGEHTDYNDGLVMPAAIAFYTTVAAAPRSDRKLAVVSSGFGGKVEFDLDDIKPEPTQHWSDYVRGVAGVLISQGHKITGADLAIASDVPVGAGLSSSAAIEVSVALALLGLSRISMDRMSIARICQKAEHVYSGTLCGIMDQFISCHGEADHALMLDCRSLKYESLPLAKDVELVICNTKVHHNLANGEYNRRRASCEEGVRLLQQFLPGIKALRDVTPEQLEAHKASLPELTYRRCRHVVAEDARVEASATALKAGDLDAFGKHMAQSHASLRDNYEVSCKELDTMVELANSIPGLIGARMTGGGFGGCTVNLVKAGAAQQFAATIAAKYLSKTGIKPEVYICKAADGASALPEARQ